MSFHVTKPPSIPLVTYVGLFAFGTPACSTPWQWVGGSIIPLQTSSLVYNRLIIWVEIDDTTLPYGYRFCFGFFAVFTPCRLHSLTTGWGSIIALQTCLLAFTEHNGTFFSYGGWETWMYVHSTIQPHAQHSSIIGMSCPGSYSMVLFGLKTLSVEDVKSQVAWSTNQEVLVVSWRKPWQQRWNLISNM